MGSNLYYLRSPDSYQFLPVDFLFGAPRRRSRVGLGRRGGGGVNMYDLFPHLMLLVVCTAKHSAGNGFPAKLPPCIKHQPSSLKACRQRTEDSFIALAARGSSCVPTDYLLIRSMMMHTHCAAFMMKPIQLSQHRLQSARLGMEI